MPFVRPLTTVSVLLVGFCGLAPAAWGDDGTASALEKEPDGWADLFAGAGPSFKGWSRGPIPPSSRGLGPVAPSQWSLDATTGRVVCKGNGGHEWIRYDTEFGDGVYHVEWRFSPVTSGKTAYNSGIYVRNSADATVWHQGQTGGGTDGFLFGQTPRDGKLTSFNLASRRTSKREKPAGEWNTFEITCRGSELSLWVNGAVVNVLKECGQPRGFVGLEAEGYEIEFRNVKFKPLGR